MSHNEPESQWEMHPLYSLFQSSKHCLTCFTSTFCSFCITVSCSVNLTYEQLMQVKTNNMNVFLDLLFFTQMFLQLPAADAYCCFLVGQTLCRLNKISTVCEDAEANLFFKTHKTSIVLFLSYKQISGSRIPQISVF